MISKFEYEKWKEQKVTKQFFEFLAYAQKQYEDNYLNTSPGIQSIGMLGSLQGRIESMKELQFPELYDAINDVLNSGEQKDDSRN